jgi:hypothetical protein
MAATGSLLGAGYFQKSEVDKVARVRQEEMVGGGEEKQQKMRERRPVLMYTQHKTEARGGDNSVYTATLNPVPHSCPLVMGT